MTDTTEADETRRDVRGVALEHVIGESNGDPFIGPCPTWCQDGHSRWERAEDRIHYGQSIDIALELEQYDAGSSTHDVTTVRTYLRQHYRETEARVVLARDERPGFTLTLAEARLLVATLTEMLEQASA
ncbi:MAG TPA: hypothetical protein VIJ41_17765 [Candidatus Nanopelagicales bacterium]